VLCFTDPATFRPQNLEPERIGPALPGPCRVDAASLVVETAPAVGIFADAQRAPPLYKIISPELLVRYI